MVMVMVMVMVVLHTIIKPHRHRLELILLISTTCCFHRIVRQVMDHPTMMMVIVRLGVVAIQKTREGEVINVDG
jgi:hypothetical protein